MGQDFVARKAAKKQRKRQARDAETGRKKRKRGKGGDFEVAFDDDDGLQAPTAEQLKRRRKKGNNVSLRISRSLCYKAPQLTAEDLAWDGSAEGAEGADGFQTVSAGFEAFEQAGYDSDVEEAFKKPQQQQKQQQQPKQQKMKLSTAVNLLDPLKAAGTKPTQKQQQQRGEQQQQQQQQLDDQVIAESPALQALISSGLNPVIPRCMAKLGFAEPTPIQAACWPLACAGHDLLGHAEPGSGKTLAFLLPAVAHLLSSSTGPQQQLQQEQQQSSTAVQPRVLILTPSRELAQQIHGQCVALFPVTAVSTAVVFGGVPKDQQVSVLQCRLPQLLVATPGRLLDLVDAGQLSLARIDYVVFDEADKMLSVGFEPQLQRLKSIILDSKAVAPRTGSTEDGQQKKKQKKKKQKQQQQQVLDGAEAGGSSRPQVLLFSATLPATVKSTAAAWLQPEHKSVSCSAGADSISRSITQVVQVCAEHKKPAKLLKHMNAIKEASAGLRNPPRVLVFANRIKTVIFVHRTLVDAGYKAVVLHGKRSQAERDAAVADFRAGKAQVLVASDVASRGLDIQGLPYVVNYDFPSNLEVYIHRVGRTGRLAAAGHSFSFFTRPLAKLAAPLIQLLRSHDQSIDPNLLELAEAWKQAEAALVAQGKSAELEAAAAAAAAAAAQEEEEGEQALDAGGGSSGLETTPEDLQEGLQQDSSQQQALPHGKQEAKKPAKSSKRAGDAIMVPKGVAASTATAAGPTAVAAASPPLDPFLPSAKFAGAKPGYAFKKGSRGMGYYLDPLQQQPQQPAAARQQQLQQQQQKMLKQVLKQQQRPQPPHKDKHKPSAAGAPAGVGSKREKGIKTKPSALPPLPGLAKKRKLPAFLASADLSDDDGGGRVMDGGGSSSSGEDSDSGGGSFQERLGKQQQKRKKALPGRLRKKLAKAAAAAGKVSKH